ncbi:putative Chromosome partition protein MukE [Actinobacillus pleuropneumoniae]|uniref:chromosome partition protein MukE n=1 Tax=Actinobacillus pleuropneumoniae TaxID=715 RepID=UPI000584EECD|nr:chromosome partition protein MukE [Actinobacillus pleuropneumoniae]KIE92304.1 putative Chromosome partition protein MukE [Actinobacillus pleuropneumoniae]KIE92443.1 putative Chromosome partition protein MukE [Actinobacillus pleuropneumoniae]KIE92567.1 putative Chromosome partition protein MukE [Actinobacillus pleuropneumoniae]KIE97532.1 putative Chromosome partition protein MukE [Actinobacillus pleuropneumoniae]KIE98758.1 putative Chromosome partition protein MukE [Actinobacillus pleuropneu
MTEQIQDVISPKLTVAIANPIFPELDSQLRAGRHINTEQLDEHAFLMDFQAELESFYRRYHVELIRAPEGFFYLCPKASTLIARSAMSEMEMLVGKVLCYLYLSPERLAQQGIFSQDDVYEELMNLADESKLLKAVNPRSTGSDLDKAKLAEKVGGALRRLARIGIITRIGEQNSKKFVISESVFRFGADVRVGDDPREVQLRLIRDGEATTPAILAEQAVEFAENSATDELEDETE